MGGVGGFDALEVELRELGRAERQLEELLEALHKRVKLLRAAGHAEDANALADTREWTAGELKKLKAAIGAIEVKLYSGRRRKT